MGRVATVLVAAVLLAACGGDDDPGSEDLSVVASIYPLAEIARQIGGDHVSVQELVPPGIEPHDVELTADDIATLQGADLVLHLGEAFQPAVADAVPVETSLDLLLETRAGEDPHIWLDPVLMRHVADLIARRLGDIDPPNRQAYLDALEHVTAGLDELNEDHAATFMRCARTSFVASHDAFGLLASRYGLTQHAIAGISPENEPTAARLEELRDLVRAEGITTIFAEELVPRRVAETLAREAGVGVELLDPIENPTDEQRAAGGYDAIMRENLRKLATAMGCEVV